MDFRYRPTEQEIKLMILYVISSLRVNATYTLLDYIIARSAAVNYFELEEHLRSLSESGNLTELTVEGNLIYSLTDSGEETAGFFAERIPYSVREKIDIAVNEINKKHTAGNVVAADYHPINETEYTVTCTIVEHHVPLLKLEVYAGEVERAKKMANYVRNHTNEVYRDIMLALCPPEPEQEEQ
ncbi:MAG: DUF4364 family protein [Ruminococcaceae bacterium]|nr:DUF4364 family protein [Oscillospiraceae bacterium]